MSQCPTDGAASEVVFTLPKGTRLGAYRIERELGEGGMGFVYEATHEVLGRRAAIKMLRPELVAVAQIVTRFLNEAKAVNLIDHQNIVNVYDYGDGGDGGVYFVMEYLEGQTLDDLMARRRPMPVPLLLHVFGQIAKALAAAHAKRIVHRDLKPGNVFVAAREGNPCFIKLLDFGIAQLRGEGAVQGLTLAGTVMGTPQYMSPEQISGGTVDARTDVWALGVMMYRAATGVAPFDGEEFAEIAGHVLHHAPRPPEQIVPLPRALSALIASCLRRGVDERCQSVAEVIAGLELAKQELRTDDAAILAWVRTDLGGPAAGPGAPTRVEGAPAPHGGGAVPTAVTRQKQSKLGLYITLAAIVGGLASAGYVVFGASDEPATPKPEPGPGSGSVVAKPAGDPGAKPPAEEAGGDPRTRAERRLRAALASADADEQGRAVDALARARVPAGAKLLHEALDGSPAVRVKAARALAELALPDSAPKVRAALAASGDKLKVELAAVLFRLGDKEARPILLRGTEDPGQRLTAALALADGGDAAGRAALAELLEVTPAGREMWRRAAGGLVKLGDAGARKLLEAELALTDAARVVGAAEVLARAGDAQARDQLARNMDDRDFARPGDAAVALARLGDARALGWAARGFSSNDPEERRHALAICGALAAKAAAHAAVIAKLATGDPDPSVRMTAEAVLLGL